MVNYVSRYSRVNIHLQNLKFPHNMVASIKLYIMWYMHPGNVKDPDIYRPSKNTVHVNWSIVLN